MFKPLAYVVLLLLCGMHDNCGDNPAKTPRNPESLPPYQEAVAQIAERRTLMAVQYHQASSAPLKIKQLAEARKLLIRSIENDIFPQWYGTPWDFYGTAEMPREGRIACGYFVSTVLRDVGFKVQRVKLGQQASELIIKSLTTEAYIKRFSNASIDEFVTAIQNWGEGIYVVGLDFHTGFIVSTKQGVFFIHSSYMEPRVVVKEVARDSVVLRESKYRVLGKISADDTLVLAWLQERAIPTKTK